MPWYVWLKNMLANGHKLNSLPNKAAKTNHKAQSSHRGNNTVEQMNKHKECDGGVT